ncbi:MAG TPA: PilZ domain-containing protein, partial [Oligoflexia bacterium]|nr:PilZ domain-containing protein [Oligoflexia bacterium]
YILDFVMVSYFLLPQVRITYFDSRVRWWENHPRYWMSSAVKLQLMERVVEAEVDNVSVGGAYLLTKETFEIGDCVRLQFKVFSNEYDVNAEIVHKGKGSGGYGARFVHTPETLEAFERLTRAMEILRIPRRPDYKNSWEGFLDWARTLLKTGRGIVPEVPEAFIHRPKQN